MMKTETKVIHRNGIRFLGNNYYNEALFGLREPVYVRYRLFDLSKVHVYTVKGEFICIARKVEKIHPMANHLGTVKDMEDFKQKIQKHKRLKNKAVKEFKKYFDIETTGILEIEQEEKPVEITEQKVKKERKQTAREQQMNKPIFADEIERFEWLMKHGTTCSEDRNFLENFFKSDQYNLLYADCEQRAKNGNGEFSFVDPFNASNQEGD